MNRILFVAVTSVLTPLFLHSLAFGFTAKRHAAEATAPVPAPTSERASTRLQSLSSVMERSLTGLDFESPDFQESIRAHATDFVKLQGKPGESPELKAALHECATANGRHAFCAILENPGAAKKKLGDIPASSLERKKRQKLKVVRGYFQKADLAKLEATSDKDLRALLREHRSFHGLKKVTEAILTDTGTCTSPKLSFLLGSKAEEFLPELEMRQLAVALYSKSATCENEHAAQARYRLSLLQIWAGDCGSAVPHLEYLVYNAKPNDYRSRALFWKAACVEQLGEKESAAATKRVLRDDHPFSLHTLLTQAESIPQLRTLLTGTDSMVRFRSVLKPDLNDLTATTEALFAINQPRTAEKILGAIGSQMDEAEPEFQLYIAYLLDKAGDDLGKFRVMSPLFQDHPAIVSWSSLALYYPRTQFKTDVAKKIGLDELLVLSLIRQESAFNERARSRAGARGLMQVMPATARLIERRRISGRELYNPEVNLKIGTKYFASLLKKYNGDAELALAAYNAGPKRVEEWLKRYPVENRVLFLDLVPFRETREYVASIARNFFWYSVLYSEPAASPVPGTAPQTPDPIHAPAGPSFPGSLRNVFKLFGT